MHVHLLLIAALTADMHMHNSPCMLAAVPAPPKPALHVGAACRHDGTPQLLQLCHSPAHTLCIDLGKGEGYIAAFIVGTLEAWWLSSQRCRAPCKMPCTCAIGGACRRWRGAVSVLMPLQRAHAPSVATLHDKPHCDGCIGAIIVTISSVRWSIRLVQGFHWAGMAGQGRSVPSASCTPSVVPQPGVGTLFCEFLLHISDGYDS